MSIKASLFSRVRWVMTTLAASRRPPTDASRPWWDSCPKNAARMFRDTVATMLPARVGHEIGRLLPS